MKKLMKCLGVLSVVVLCLFVATEAPAAIEQAKSGTGSYGSYGYNYGSSCTGNYGISPYPRSVGYCMRWVPGRWVPVTIRIPGRWEYRRVWIPGYPTTLYRPVPGYWQRTSYNARPDLSVWRAPGGNWYATQYQGQPGGFDRYGVWRSYPQGAASPPEK